VALPAFARRTTAVQQSISISCQPGPQQQIHSSGGRMGRTDGQTDGRTDARQLHRPCSAYHADSANNKSNLTPQGRIAADAIFYASLNVISAVNVLC